MKISQNPHHVFRIKIMTKQKTPPHYNIKNPAKFSKNSPKLILSKNESQKPD